MADPTDSQIQDLALSVDVGGATAICGPGVCYLPGTSRLSTDVAITAAVSGLTPNSWVHAYGWMNASFVMQLEISATSPDVPYQGTARCKLGDTTRRYLGSYRVDSTGKLIPILHRAPGSKGNRVYYYATNGIADAPYTILSGITAQTPTLASAAAQVPLTARVLLGFVDNTAALLGTPFYIGDPDLGTVSTTNYQIYQRLGSASHDILLNASQQFSYMFGPGLSLGGTASVKARGYAFDR